MKTFVAVATLLAITSPSIFAQDEIEKVDLHESIKGTWRLPQDGGATRYKFVGDGMWAITQANPTNGEVIFHHGGRYTLDGSSYKEYLDFATPNTKGMIGKTLTFELTINDNVWTQKGIGNPYSEVWNRVIHTEKNKLVTSNWGMPFDPDGDCTITMAGDVFKIKTPGGSNSHDLAAEIGVTNAPRSLQEIEGDFTATVQIDGEFVPGKNSSQIGRTAYNGAGLVLLENSEDPQNAITLARAVLQRGPDAHGYANFEMRDQGELVRMGSTRDGGLPTSGNVFLRIQRRGNLLHGSFSADGIEWKELPSKTIPAEWSAKLKVGVAAISTSEAPFEATFANLTISE